MGRYKNWSQADHRVVYAWITACGEGGNQAGLAPAADEWGPLLR